MTSEKKIQTDITLELNSENVRLWRNDTGTAYRGRISRHKDCILIGEPKLISYGLCKGSSDLIGFQSKIITPEMVGQRVAIFLAVECKNEDGKATDEQIRFIDMVNAKGGKACIARSVYEAMEVLK